MHWWSWQYPVKDAAAETGVSEPTAVQVYAWLRDYGTSQKKMHRTVEYWCKNQIYKTAHQREKVQNVMDVYLQNNYSKKTQATV